MKVSVRLPFLWIYKPGKTYGTLDLTILMFETLIGLDNKASWYELEQFEGG